jgi:hypothetical protein
MTAIAATVATAPAVATITAMATIAAVAAIPSVATIAMASATVAMTAIAAVAAIAAAGISGAGEAAENEGRRLVFTADEGDANQREKHRDTQHNNSVHPQILQLTYRYRKRELLILSCRLSKVPPRQPTACVAMRFAALLSLNAAFRKSPCCEDLRIAENVTMAKVRS